MLTEKYMVGCVPPPHLSPFVDNEAEGHVPEYAEAIQRLKATERKEVLPLPGAGKEDLDDSQSLLGIIDLAQAMEAAEIKRKMAVLEKQYHNELNLELQGVQYSAVSNEVEGEDDAEGETAPDINQIAVDEANMSKISMSRKKRKLYEAMEIGIGRKRTAKQRLKEREKRIVEAKKLEFD